MSENTKKEVVVEDEIKELESSAPQGDQLKTEVAEFMEPIFTDNVYASFCQLIQFAREVRVELGKLSTKRPVYITLQNNPECDTPKCTLRRDLTSEVPGADRDVEIPLKVVSGEIKKRQSEKCSSVPIRVQIEYKNCMNMVLIDTPAIPEKLKDEDSKETKKEDKSDETFDAEEAILKLARPTHRTLVCVEEASEWGKIQMLNFLKKVDPTFTRTVFVYTKFHSFLKTLNSTDKLNRYLAGKPRDTNCFFVSLFSNKVRSQCIEDEKFHEKIYQAYKRDQNILDKLQYDKTFSENIGVHNLRRFIQMATWKSYQSSVPEILKKLRYLQRETQLKLSKIGELFNTLDSSKLRNIASNYVVTFLQIIDKLIAGTSEGNPSVNGQTLEEEKQYGCGEWFDANYQEIIVDAEGWKIPYWNSRIYGGQQFDRLLSEFRALVNHTKIGEITMDDIATASGINKLNNVPNYVWAASDIAQQKSREAIGILIEQLTKRAVYIMQRLTNVAEKIMESRKKNNKNIPHDDFDNYPYFIYHVKDLYNEFVDQTSERVKEKCMDEFYCTSTIYYDVTDLKGLGKDIPTDSTNEEEVKNAVIQLATKVFEDLKQRITNNVILKFYNFFLVPMQTSLWNEIQSHITTLSDEALEEIFEINAVKEKLAEDKKQLLELEQKCAKQQAEFLKASTIFNHPTTKQLKEEVQNTQTHQLNTGIGKGRISMRRQPPSWKQ